MQTSTEPIVQPEWQQVSEPPPADPTRWLYRAGRFSLLRAHISVFAAGSVVLFSLNLLSGSSRVWASDWVSAWALIVIIHAIIAVIAMLAVQLLADDDDIRPASEVRWAAVTTWVTPPLAPEPEPTTEAPKAQTDPEPEVEPDPWQAPPAPPKDEERVSWQAASDAAWLNQAPDDDSDAQPDHGYVDESSTDRNRI